MGTKKLVPAGSKAVPPTPQPQNLVLIHVCDENKKVTQDFKCDRHLLLQHMKYFEKYLVNDQKNLDEIDISVHCDIVIFDWLMKFVHRQKPEQDIKNAVSILISSDFLQMSGLVEDSLDFVVRHIEEIIQLPIDMNCLNSSLVKKLASKVDLETLDSMKDKRDKLQSKLFMKKLELVFDKPENLLTRCVHCSQLFTKAQLEWQKCPKGSIFVTASGEVTTHHVGDKAWELNKFVMSLRAQKVAWKYIFWKFFSCMLEFKCSTCGDRFTGNMLNQCHYHESKPSFLAG